MGTKTGGVGVASRSLLLAQLWMNGKQEHAASLLLMGLAHDMRRDENEEIRNVILRLIVGGGLKAGEIAEAGNSAPTWRTSRL